MLWHLWLRRRKEAVSLARYAEEVLNAGWVRSPQAIRIESSARSAVEREESLAFLKRASTEISAADSAPLLRFPGQPALMVFTSTPTLLISTSTVSPGFIHTGGLRRAPTPPGVPVTITSPGSSGVKVEM